MKKLLFVVGSAREHSFNKTLALEAAKLMQDKAEISFLDYTNIPFMNQDLEANPPEIIPNLRAMFLESDGIWFFTPEYNGMIPGLLKNLLDWMSRPLEAGNFASGTALKGKAATASGAGGRRATALVREQLDQLCKNCLMRVMEEDQVGIALPPEAMQSGSWTPNQEEDDLLLKQGEAFLKFIG